MPVYLVAKAHVSGVTMWGKDETRGFCVLSVTALQDSQLVTAILHEAIHALDLETKGKGNVIVDFQQRLLKAGFAADDLLVRHGPHMLVFIQSSETVRRLIDPSYEPYGEGVFVRPALAPIAKVQPSTSTTDALGMSALRLPPRFLRVVAPMILQLICR